MAINWRPSLVGEGGIHAYDRSYYSSTQKEIVMRPDADDAVVAHEIGHHLAQVTFGDNYARDFIYDRAEWTTHPLRRMTGDLGYTVEEVAHADRFINPYVGKEYPGSSTEVVSMGVENMMRDPQWFYEHDREHFLFTKYVMDGGLRKGYKDEKLKNSNPGHLGRPGLVGGSAPSGHQTDTPEFRKWFSGSRLVDGDGKPIVVYHSSTFGDFDKFNKSSQAFGKAGYGFYFSNQDGANLFSEYGSKFQHPTSWDGKPNAVKIYPVYLQMKNPLVLNHVDDLEKYLDPGQKFGVARGIFGNLSPEAQTKIQKLGYDGVIARETTAQKVHKTQGLKILDRNDPKAKSFPVYIVFEPTQIKSAIGNKGTWNPKDPIITNSDFGHAGRPCLVGGSAPSDSMAAHSVNGEFSAARQLLHNRIVESIRAGVPASDSPEFVLMGGGTAAGKSNVVKSGSVHLPDSHVLIDSDAIKSELPEYHERLRAGDVGAASWVHEESSHLAKRAMKESFAAHQNVVLDGTGNSSLKAVAEKAADARAHGYTVRGEYVTCPTEQAVARAKDRAERTGRQVPESAIRAIHSSVSRIFPQAVAEGVYDKANLWDTERGTPVLVASSIGKNLTVHSPELWQKFINKGKQA